jgi:hypothetical protein
MGLMTDHIIQSEDGQTYDLTTNRIAFGLLPKDVQDALSAWPHGIELFLYGPDKWIRSDSTPPYDLHSVSEFVYRARPAPKGTEHVMILYNHRIIIRDDGTGNVSATVEKL